MKNRSLQVSKTDHSSVLRNFPSSRSPAKAPGRGEEGPLPAPFPRSPLTQPLAAAEPVEEPRSEEGKRRKRRIYGQLDVVEHVEHIQSFLGFVLDFGSLFGFTQRVVSRHFEDQNYLDSISSLPKVHIKTTN